MEMKKENHHIKSYSTQFGFCQKNQRVHSPLRTTSPRNRSGSNHNIEKQQQIQKIQYQQQYNQHQNQYNNQNQFYYQNKRSQSPQINRILTDVNDNRNQQNMQRDIQYQRVYDQYQQQNVINEDNNNTQKVEINQNFIQGNKNPQSDLKNAIFSENTNSSGIKSSGEKEEKVHIVQDFQQPKQDGQQQQVLLQEVQSQKENIIQKGNKQYIYCDKCQKYVQDILYVQHAQNHYIELQDNKQNQQQQQIQQKLLKPPLQKMQQQQQNLKYKRNINNYQQVQVVPYNMQKGRSYSNNLGQNNNEINLDNFNKGNKQPEQYIRLNSRNIRSGSYNQFQLENQNLQDKQQQQQPYIQHKVTRDQQQQQQQLQKEEEEQQQLQQINNVNQQVEKEEEEEKNNSNDLNIEYDQEFLIRKKQIEQDRIKRQQILLHYKDQLKEIVEFQKKYFNQDNQQQEQLKTKYNQLKNQNLNQNQIELQQQQQHQQQQEQEQQQQQQQLQEQLILQRENRQQQYQQQQQPYRIQGYQQNPSQQQIDKRNYNHYHNSNCQQCINQNRSHRNRNYSNHQNSNANQMHYNQQNRNQNQIQQNFNNNQQRQMMVNIESVPQHYLQQQQERIQQFQYEKNSQGGLSQNVKELFEEILVKNVEKQQQDNIECKICMCDFENGEKVRFLLCLHRFHTDCIDAWLQKHTDCPVCKKDQLKLLNNQKEQLTNVQ